MMSDSGRRFSPRDAGGTPGGAGSFFLGLGLMITGGYLFLKSVYVYGVSLWGPMASVYGWDLSGGMILIPAMIGVAMIFCNGNSVLGWLLAIGSVVALVAGIIASLRFSLHGMSLFDLLLVLGLFAAGAGLFARSLRPRGR